jgi:hypothetical protein
MSSYLPQASRRASTRQARVPRNKRGLCEQGLERKPKFREQIACDLIARLQQTAVVAAVGLNG